MSTNCGEKRATVSLPAVASTLAVALQLAMAEISAVTSPISTPGGTTSTTSSSTEARCAAPSTGKYIQLYDLLYHIVGYFQSRKCCSCFIFVEVMCFKISKNKYPLNITHYMIYVSCRQNDLCTYIPARKVDVSFFLCLGMSALIWPISSTPGTTSNI